MAEPGVAATALGAQLRGYRERAGLSQEALAERAGLAVAAISALERGVRRRPFPHTLAALAEALDLSPAERAAFIAAARPAGEPATTADGATNRGAPGPTQGAQGPEAPAPAQGVGARTSPVSTEHATAGPTAPGDPPATPPSNLPLAATPLIGREREAAALADLLC